MKQTYLLVSLASIILLLSPNNAQASTTKYANVSVTLPDAITITGAEVGIDSRSCIFNVFVDADAGTSFPLRSRFLVVLQDSLGSIIDTGDFITTTEGITHQQFQGKSRCDDWRGTLKAPYNFMVAYQYVSLENSNKLIDVPVTVSFVAPTPTVSSQPLPSKPLGSTWKSITCTKGKTTVRMNPSPNPKCPKGWKQK